MPPLSNCICPKLFEEKLCDTLLVDGYNGDSTSSMLLPPRPCPKPNGLFWEPATVGLSGILTLPSPKPQLSLPLELEHRKPNLKLVNKKKQTE